MSTGAVMLGKLSFAGSSFGTWAFGKSGMTRKKMEIRGKTMYYLTILHSLELLNSKSPNMLMFMETSNWLKSEVHCRYNASMMMMICMNYLQYLA
jgi:hypothetical protein